MSRFSAKALGTSDLHKTEHEQGAPAVSTANPPGAGHREQSMRGTRHRARSQELTRRQAVALAIFTLAGITNSPSPRCTGAQEEGSGGPKTPIRSRELLVDAEPKLDRIRAHCPAWHYHLFRQVFVPLRSAEAPPFTLAFASWIRDWRYTPAGDGVELWLEPDGPMTVLELAEMLQSWNRGGEGVAIRIRGPQRLLVRSQTSPVWRLFPPLLPRRRRSLTWAWERGANTKDANAGKDRSLVITSPKGRIVLMPPEEQEGASFGSAARISVGATLWAARRLLSPQDGTRLLVDRIPRVGCLLVNSEAVPDREQRRAVAQLVRSRTNVEGLLPAPLYIPTASLFPSEGTDHLKASSPPDQGPPRLKNIPDGLTVDVPDYDPELAEVLAELTGPAGTTGSLRVRPISLDKWEERVCNGDYRLAYWEFDWRFGEATILDAFRIERGMRPGIPHVPVRDPTIQALLHLVQQPRTPREWRAAAVELSTSLLRDGYVIPLWNIREFARVPAGQGRVKSPYEHVSDLFSLG